MAPKGTGPGVGAGLWSAAQDDPARIIAVMPATWLLALGLALGLIVLIPARRLQLAGVSRGAAAAYVAVLWALGMVIAIRPVGIRFLLPILLIAYLAPFVAGPDRVARVLSRRRPTDRPIKDVTPPHDDPPDMAA